MTTNKQGVEKKEYPKLVKGGDGKKVRVNSRDEENKLLGIVEEKEEKKKKAPEWGNK